MKRNMSQAVKNDDSSLKIKLGNTALKLDALTTLFQTKDLSHLLYLCLSQILGLLNLV
jgi:hypothetical protein